MGQRQRNTGRRRWYVYVEWRKIQSQMNGVDMARHRRRADSHLLGMHLLSLPQFSHHLLLVKYSP